MDIGTSLILVAVGAILAFAVDDRISGVELSTVGIILMIVGGVGLLLSLLVWGPRRRAVVRERVGDPDARVY